MKKNRTVWSLRYQSINLLLQLVLYALQLAEGLWHLFTAKKPGE